MQKLKEDGGHRQEFSPAGTAVHEAMVWGWNWWQYVHVHVVWTTCIWLGGRCGPADYQFSGDMLDTDAIVTSTQLVYVHVHEQSRCTCMYATQERRKAALGP